MLATDATTSISGARDRHVVRHPFLQQQFGRLDHRLGMEAPAHRAIADCVGDGDHAHALVMCHVCVNDGYIRTLGQACLRIVQCFITAVPAAPASRCQAFEIGRRGRGIDQCRQRRRIGRDHRAVPDPALEAETGDAETGILVGELQVARVVGGFRGAPGHVARAPYLICWRTSCRLVCWSRLPAGRA